jgi:hypothetical protein
VRGREKESEDINDLELKSVLLLLVVRPSENKREEGLFHGLVTSRNENRK